MNRKDRRKLIRMLIRQRVKIFGIEQEVKNYLNSLEGRFQEIEHELRCHAEAHKAMRGD
jgi:hypothetical protein